MGKVRVELIQDFGPRKGQVVAGVVVEACHKSLLAVAAKKLQLSKKETNNVVLYCSDFTGLQPLPEGNLSEILHNGAKVIVSLGEWSETLQSHQGLPKKVQKALDELRFVQVGTGSLSARGRPGLETLAALKAQRGLTAVVSLLRMDEPGAGSMHEAERLGLKYCQAPLAGPKAMQMIGTARVRLSEEDLDSFRKVIQVKAWLMQGTENVVVHCAAGLHRTGIFLYVLLRELGATPPEALQMIKQMREATFEEFVRLDFHEKAEAIYCLVRSDGSNSSAKDLVEIVKGFSCEEAPEVEDDSC